MTKPPASPTVPAFLNVSSLPIRPSPPPLRSAFLHPLSSSKCFRITHPQLPSKSLRTILPTASAAKQRRPIRELSTMAEPLDFLPPLRAKVSSVTALDHASEYIQLTLDVSHTSLHLAHTAPGQTLRLGRLDQSAPQSVVAVIASPPDAGPTFHFMIARAADPCNLASVKPGDTLAVGEVIGKGIDVSAPVDAHADLYLFVDTPQAFACVRSLVEWTHFRTITGNGANRVTNVTIYYSLPSNAIPYAQAYSNWSVFGVNVFPIQGRSIMEFMGTSSATQPRFHSSARSFATCIFATEATYESLFCALVLAGFRRSAISKMTDEEIASMRNDLRGTKWKPIDMNDASRKEGLFDEDEDDAKAEEVRRRIEEEIWQRWVQNREAMRSEFERKWRQQKSQDRHRETAEREKRQAWESWSVKSEEQWSKVYWDDSAWNTYWKTWADENGSSKGQTSGTGGSYGSQQKHRGWNQTESQEYWDWVGKGSTAGRSASSKGRRNASHWWSSYSGGGGGGGGSTGAWESASKKAGSNYERGYRYEYDGPSDDNKTNSSWKSQSGRQNGRKGGRNGGWYSWKGWGNKGGQSGSSSSSSRSYSSSTGSSGSIDLYAVLGINAKASRDEIKKAYRRQAMEHHPDRNPSRKEDAHVRMKQIVVAWTILKDPSSRLKYDQYGEGGM